LTDTRGDLIRTVHWRRIGHPGTERLDLWRSPQGWMLDGAVEAFDTELFRVSYRVRCTPGWETVGAAIQVVAHGSQRSLDLAFDRNAGWSTNGDQAPGLGSCTDIDLGVTPSTNTLPIRRLQLEVGATERILAAWVRFPGLDVTASEQRYTRLSDRRYLYESATFRAEVEVDDLDLVTTYAGIWERA
jgi:uncharacterized protein